MLMSINYANETFLRLMCLSINEKNILAKKRT